MARDRLTLAEARRLALAAQGFGSNRQNPVDAMQSVVRRIGLLQLDFVNVLVPAHYLVVWSRIGNYDRQYFDEHLCAGSAFTEQWAHEASIVPMEAWPLLEHRRIAFRASKHSPINRMRNKLKYLSQVIEIIKENGPVTSGDLPSVPGPKRNPGDWHRSIPRAALDYHFGSGRLAVARRLPNFQRVYDLAERVVPQELLQQKTDKQTAQRALLIHAAKACGVACLRDLADYYRMPVPEARPIVRELEEQGELIPVDVEGWSERAWLSPDAPKPGTGKCSTLLSPFDPVVWFRPRAERLFDFHYRIEIYVPEPQRKWGYYVLPFLLDDRLVARVDLKADRASGTLLVRSVHGENNIDEDYVCYRLVESLYDLAQWLGLNSIKIGRRGKLARKLQEANRTMVS